MPSKVVVLEPPHGIKRGMLRSMHVPSHEKVPEEGNLLDIEVVMESRSPKVDHVPIEEKRRLH